MHIVGSFWLISFNTKHVESSSFAPSGSVSYKKFENCQKGWILPNPRAETAHQVLQEVSAEKEVN